MAALSDFDTETLAAQFAQWGFKPSHADRLLREYFQRGGVLDLAGLKLGHALTEHLQRELPLRQAQVRARAESRDGTVKFLVAFSQGGAVETTLMHTNQPARAAGCLSSQIGCAMGCDFCASTQRGLERNLTAGEIIEQFLFLKDEALRGGRQLHSLVFMGMGEPLLNFDNVAAAIRRIASAQLGALGGRHMMVSTVGIVPGIERLAKEKLNVTLALSLHAPDDETRARIVPANKRHPVAEILAATQRYYETTRRITNVEYCLLGGVNDSDAQARKLAALLRGFRTHVNLIPYNAIGAGLSGTVYQPPEPARARRFLEILRAEKIVTHLRQPRGDDVNAACGQLRAAAITAAP